jgi:hypothetical protein
VHFANGRIRHLCADELILAAAAPPPAYREITDSLSGDDPFPRGTADAAFR